MKKILIISKGDVGSHFIQRVNQTYSSENAVARIKKGLQKKLKLGNIKILISLVLNSMNLIQRVFISCPIF